MAISHAHNSTLTLQYKGVRSTVADVTTLSVLADTITLVSISKLTRGPGAGQSNAIYDGVRTLAVGASESLVLSDGSLINTLLEPVKLNAVKRLIVVNQGVDSTLVIGGAGTNPWFAGFLSASTTTVHVGPGGTFTWDMPNVGALVTASSADQLKFAHLGDGATGLTYEVLIEGIDPNNS